MSHIEDLPNNFIELVKDALEKLYDFKALQENELTQKFAAQLSDTGVSSVHKLRSQLIEAIESLNHGENVASQSGTARVYHLIYMHYVSKLTVQQIAWEVGISLRQAYRDLRRGQELVAALLWQKLNVQATVSQPVSTFQEELLRLGDSTSVCVLQDMLESAIRAIQILADKHGTEIEVNSCIESIMLTTNPIIAQQVLIHILSQIIQQITPNKLDLQLFNDDCFVRFQYASTAPELHIKPVIAQMMDKINWTLNYHIDNGLAELCLVSLQRRVLLSLIDDNDSLTDLIQRYLPDTIYTVMPIPNSDDGLAIIQQLQPDVIILDLMMPDMDGWEVLQRLRTQPTTKNIPVIICSVINDPELAFSLGASQYIPKPVTREALYHALQELDLTRQSTP